MALGCQGLYELFHAFCFFVPKDLFIRVVDPCEDLADGEVFVVESQENRPANFAQSTNQLHDLGAQLAFGQLANGVVWRLGQAGVEILLPALGSALPAQFVEPAVASEGIQEAADTRFRTEAAICRHFDEADDGILENVFCILHRSAVTKNV